MADLILNLTTAYFNSFGLFGAFMIIVLESFIPPIPDSLFFALNFKTFGFFIGFFVSYFATITGASLVYLLCYYLGKKKTVIRFIKNNSKVSFYAHRFKHISLSTLSICISLPFLPAFAFPLAAGLVKMSYKKLLIALFIGKVSLVLFWGYVGDSLLGSFADPKVLLWLAGTMLIAYIISKYLSKRYKLEE